MVIRKVRYFKSVNSYRFLCEGMKVPLRLEIVIINRTKWPKRIIKIVIQLTLESLYRPGRIDVQVRIWEKNWDKIADTLHVIPVKVGKEEVIVSGFVG